jgi:NAD+ kinase
MPGGSVIEVRLKLPEKEALVVVDGQSSTSVSSQDRIVISKAKTPARFVKVAEGGFYAKVKSKLT